MSALWQGLLANLGIIAILLSLWPQAVDWAEGWPRSIRALALTCLTSAATVLLMSLPFEIEPGVFVDLRRTPIALAGFFGGAPVGLATGAIAALYRASQGGAGATAGIVGIGLATLIGLAGRSACSRPRNSTGRRVPSRRRRRGERPGWILVLPAGIGQATFWAATIASAILVFVSTLVAGLAILNEQRRREVTRANMMYRAIFDALPDSLNAKDLMGRFLAANPATAKLMRAENAEALLGRTDFDFYPRETALSFRADEEKVLGSGQALTIEQRLVRDDGAIAWLSTLKAPLRDRAGAMIGLLTHNREITDRKRLEDDHAKTQRRLADALASMADALVMFDSEDRLVFCNDQYRSLFPKTADLRIPGARFSDILRASIERGEQVGIPPDDAEAWIERTCASLRTAGDADIALGDGRWLHTRVRPTADGASLSLISDMTREKMAERQLSELNERLAELARTDGLTGLPNRRAFDEMLEREFKRSARTKVPLSLLLIDVDHFKAFNDTYGHLAGDDCLRAVANALRLSLLRPGDVPARYGGEEFAAILPETKADGSFAIAEAFRVAVRNLAIPHVGSDKGILTVSVGVATFVSGGPIERIEQLILRADEALYGAKSAGRDRVHGGPPRLTADARPRSAART